MKRGTLTVGVALAGLASCSTQASSDEKSISKWGLFADASLQIPVEGVVPYELNSPLFSDFAAKHRFIRLPGGATIGYSDSDAWSFPEGTVLVKTFAFRDDLRDPSSDDRLIETRLLVHEPGGWKPYVYLWNEHESDATEVAAGARVNVNWVDESGAAQELEYRVPNLNQCARCHGGSDDIGPLGPKSPQLDRDNPSYSENQLDHFHALGWFSQTPSEERTTYPAPDDESASIEARARAYLDANCAHCHREGGAASSSGLWLTYEETDPLRLGVCKRPPAAGSGTGGFDFDIVPGNPEQSIMVFRMSSTDPDIKMPELPSQLVDPRGVELVRQWIAGMSGTCE